MGNASSTQNKNRKNDVKQFRNFYEIIDYIASYYILTTDFQSLSRLSEKNIVID